MALPDITEDDLKQLIHEEAEDVFTYGRMFQFIGTNIKTGRSSSLVWFGLFWFGLVWFGLAWRG